MTVRRRLPYPTFDGLLDAARVLGGRRSVVGRSVDGRPIEAFELGARGGLRVLLTGLVHGNEVIGALGLIRALDALRGAGLLGALHVVAVPVVNPDAARASLDGDGAPRTNRRGVDLNRNFAPALPVRSWHPFSGSGRRWSTHYRGEAPWSEPETRALRDVAVEHRPSVALGFHSIGGLLLHPWSCVPTENPRADAYAELGGAFAAAQRRPYRVLPGRSWYPTIGDLDDWLDHALGTLAVTVEVGRVGLGVLVDRFWWMNPPEVEDTVDDVARGVVALVARALGHGRDVGPADATSPALPRAAR